ncbi:MAG: DUF1554 domain-containing protein [Polyangiaceae bacterium]
MRNFSKNYSVMLVALATCGLWVGCSGSTTDPNGSGGESGAAGSGGSSGSGGRGASGGSGGFAASAGSGGSEDASVGGAGGTAGSGGSSGAGASAGSGGTVSTGGSGGAATGGTSAGGSGGAATGGSGGTATGGSSAGGSGGAATGGSSAGGSGGADAGKPCGNGVIDASEACDDGKNEGMKAGDCAPDCSRVVVERVLKTGGASNGDLATGYPNAVAGADARCGTGFRAMFSDGTNRIASKSALAGDGQVDWPLTPWTIYKSPTGTAIGRTGETGLLGVEGGIWKGLWAKPGLSNAAWTGLLQDYTSSTVNCSGWTSSSAGVVTYFGNSGFTTQQFLEMQGLTNTCDFTRFLYCVEAP